MSGVKTIEAFRLGIDPMPDWFTDEVAANRVTLHNKDGRHLGGPDEAHIWSGTTWQSIAHKGDYICRGERGIYRVRPWIFEGREPREGDLG